MYSDFLRARKKLKRKYNYTRPRPSRWNLHRRMEKTLVVLLSKASDHCSRYYSDASDVYRDISDAARQVSSVLRLNRPCLNGIFGAARDKKDSDKNDEMSQDEPLDATMFLALVRILLKREIEKLPAFENGPCIMDDDVFPDDNLDFKSETHFDTFEETKQEIISENVFPPIERGQSCDDAGGGHEADIILLHDIAKINDENCEISDFYHPCCQAESNDSVRTLSLDLSSLRKDNNASFSDIIPDIEDDQSGPNRPAMINSQMESHKKNEEDFEALPPCCWANSAGPSKDHFDSEKHTMSECLGRESIGLIDWNELCADRSDVSEVEHSQFSEDVDGVSNRITYNTKPTDSTYPTTPVFVCSAATMNTDALQFGEELSEIGVATNFNVNAVNNKDPLWKGLKADLTPDDLRQKDTDAPNLSSSSSSSSSSPGDDTNTDQETLRTVDEFWSKTFLSDSKWWVCLRHTAANHWPGPGDQTVTTALCVLAAMCVFLLIATGNVLSLVGVVLDVIVHAALLSLVVIIAIIVHEANDETSNPFIQWCNTFLEITGCVEPPDSNKCPKECQPSSATAHPLGGGDNGCYGNNDDNNDNDGGCGGDGGGGDDDDEKCSKMAIQDVQDVDDSGLDFSIVSEAEASALTPSGSQRKSRKCKSESCEVSTMTDGIALTDCPVWSQNDAYPSSSEPNTTEPKALTSASVQTDALCEDGDAVVNYLPINDDGEVTQPRDVGMRSIEAQANIDAQKINEYAQRLQHRHQRNMRRLQRKFLAIRRRMRRDAHQLKSCDQQRGDFLAKLQLTVPTLQMEKNRLTAERFMFERQYMYQRKKNQDLVGRITKLNQQFQVLGQTHQPPATTVSWRPPHLNRNIAPCANLFGGPQSDIQQQQQQQQHQQQQHQQQQQQRQEQTKPPLASNIKTTTQITLTQPLTPPSVPNKWLNNLQQQQQLQQILPPPPAPPQQLQQMKHHQQQQQQQQQQVQQARLSIFQLLRNSASLATHPEDTGQPQSINEDIGK